MPIDARLRGTNIPAWLHSEDRPLFDDSTFQARTIASGVSVLRMPGGSWGNFYDWLGCETDNDQRASTDGCYWPWAARPSDFAKLLRETGQSGMWIVSMQGTSKEAAALVAFFNGEVSDTRPIGIDVNGRDWLTVGHWAQLRSDHGSPEPLGVRLWEIGNEIYGAKPATGGPDCAPFGWEEVWTCDGDEYVHGDGQHEGYLAFREEMRKVDPDIMVGAVGVPKQSDWNDWGNKVIAGAGDVMDFYSIHYYAYSSDTSDYTDVLAQPQSIWKPMMDDVRSAFERHSPGRQVPVAITEYNLFAFRELDSHQLMAKAVNALYMADTLGQLAQNGFGMANQYDLANGDDGSGTADVYGMLHGNTLERAPQYYAFSLWARFGSQLLPVRSRFDAAHTLSVYAGRSEDGTISVMAINKSDAPLDVTIQIDGPGTFASGSADQILASALDANSVTFNGVAAPADDLSDAPPVVLEGLTGQLRYTFPPFSVTLLRLNVAQAH
jgi:alpha-L-arabinofuranosidase